MSHLEALRLEALTRRTALKLLAALSGGGLLSVLAPADAAEDPDEVAIRSLKPGTFVWYPERAPDGFVAVVVNLTDQRAYVYRNGVRIGVATVSTGKAGHETPTGVFTILQKDADHHSSVYNNASMPFTERLTWSGVALHAGGLPGYPSSHGCVHLPLEFAKKLFAITHLGTAVIIAKAHSAPEDVLHPGLVMQADLAQELEVAATGQGRTGEAPQPQSAQTTPAQATPAQAGSASPPPSPAPAAPAPLSLVASKADKSIFVLQGGKLVLEGGMTVANPDAPIGNIVYVLAETGGETNPRWHAITYEGGAGTAGAAMAALSRLSIDKAVNVKIATLLRPGATLLVTDLPADPSTRSGEDFVVMNEEKVS